MEEIERLQNKEETKENIITTLLLAINIIVWSVILIVAIFFMGILKVNAASIDYDNTTNYIHKTNGTAEWIQFPRATEYNLNTLNTYDQINLQWTNYQGGVANGVARFEISSISLQALSCNQLYESIRIQENGNTIQVPIQRNSCIKDPSTNYVLVEVGFVTSLLGTNSYFEVQFRNNIQLASKVRAYGVMTVNSIDPATNTDIQDQTNALINNNNSNTQIITNAVENSTTNIINQMQDNLNICENYNETLNTTNGIEGNLTSNGEDAGNTNYVRTDYIKVNQNTTINFNFTNTRNGYERICLYDKNKNNLSCNSETTQNVSITTQQEGYFRVDILKTNTLNYNYRLCQDRTQAEIDELKVLQQLMHTEPWEDIEPDDTWFELYEDSEDTLNEYQDVDLSNIDIDIDTDTSNWVWNTLTSLLNTNSYVFGMVITILSIGIGKLILGR